MSASTPGDVDDTMGEMMSLAGTVAFEIRGFLQLRNSLKDEIADDKHFFVGVHERWCRV
jgi:hypothetical protein